MIENNNQENIELEQNYINVEAPIENAEVSVAPVEEQTVEAADVVPKHLEVNTVEKHIDWIKKCINSCTNIEQLENCNSLVGIFIFRLKRDGVSEKTIESAEDELLKCYVDKEGIFVIPKNNPFGNKII